MITKLEISGVHTHVTPELYARARSKIGRLDKYMSTHARRSAHIEILLKETKARDQKTALCEAVVYMPNEKLIVKESAQNMASAIDIVQAKLKQRLQKYKELHGFRRPDRKVLRRLQQASLESKSLTNSSM